MKCIVIVAFLLFTCIIGNAQTPSPTPVIDGAAEKARADRLQGRLTDFATLARYRDANAALAPPAKNEDRVVFFGDSITDGWKLAEQFPGKPYVNRGIGGQSTYHMLLRFRADVIDLKPKVVVILAGTNDISVPTEQFKVETVKSNLQSMVDLAHANGIKVVLSSILPVSDYNSNAKGDKIIRTGTRPPALINELNSWIKTLCSTRGIVYLDYFSAMSDDKGLFKSELARDGLHPNQDGYSVMKPLAEVAIKQALKKK
ncbi:MAG TPA: SGNH/GDSL hydrolase family protein [Pyrinomonadaceae bacterium]|nr:SGNH/GDSL hydrolase family protein [Pyrinomonadaceae bacterium]